MQEEKILEAAENLGFTNYRIIAEIMKKIIPVRLPAELLRN